MTSTRPRTARSRRSWRQSPMRGKSTGNATRTRRGGSEGAGNQSVGWRGGCAPSDDGGGSLPATTSRPGQDSSAGWPVDMRSCLSVDVLDELDVRAPVAVHDVAGRSPGDRDALLKTGSIAGVELAVEILEVN